MSDDYDSSAPFDETAFHKTLPSDIDDPTALGLLNEIVEHNDLFTEFQDEEIEQVVEVFSVLKMAPGEKMITKGEYATFCGIVLQGTFNAVVTPTFTVPLKPGDLVGEMSLFEGGARNADIVTGTDEGGCILAVITFVDLDLLTMNERYSALARKLTMLFATASIKKLRGMLKAAPAAPAAAPAATTGAEASGATPAAATEAAGDAATAAAPAGEAAAAGSAAESAPAPAADAAAPATSAPAATAATPASPSGSAVNAPATAPAAAVGAAGGKKKGAAKKAPVVAETLYKNKMHANKVKSAAAAGGTDEAGNALPAGAGLENKRGSVVGGLRPDGSGDKEKARPANMNDAQKEIEEQAYKLKKMEHAARNQKVTLDKTNRQLKAAEERGAHLDAEVARLSSELAKAQEAAREVGVRYATQSKALEDMTHSFEREHEARLASEAKLTLSAADLSKRLESEVSRLTAELAQVQSERATLDAALNTEKTAHAATLSSKESDSARAASALTSSSADLDRVSKDLVLARQSNHDLEVECKAQSKLVDEQRLAMASLSSKILDLDEKLSSALTWKHRALEFQTGLDAEKKRHMMLSDAWGRKEKEQEAKLKAYRLILRKLTLTVYAKELLHRRRLAALHRRVSDMLLSTLEEHYATSTGREKLAMVSATGAGGPLLPGGAASGGAGALGASTSVQLSSASSATFKSVRKRKKAYLDSLLRPQSKLKDVLLSLDEEVFKLRGPLDAIRERCVHWRATSESFFQRNIELASKLMAMGREKGTSGGNMQTPATQHAGAGGNAGMERDRSNSSSAGGLAEDASSASLLQGSSGSKPHEHSGVARLGSTGRKEHDGLISNAASSKELHARGGHAGGGKAHGGASAQQRFASGKQELELLEARCTVLRVHIQQLEQHYLNLQLAIHQGSSGVAGTGPGAVPLQESKEQLQLAAPRAGAEMGGQFDPSLVPAVPFPPPAQQQALLQQQQLLLMQQQAQAQAQQHAFALAQQMHYLQLQQQAAGAQRPGTVGGAAPSGSLSARSYSSSGNNGRGYTFNGAATTPLSPKPDVLSLRALRDNQAAQAHAQQGQQHQQQQRLPAVPGALPPPSGQQPILLTTPQRPTLTFSPRPS